MQISILKYTTLIIYQLNYQLNVKSDNYHEAINVKSDNYHEAITVAITPPSLPSPSSKFIIKNFVL